MADLVDFKKMAPGVKADEVRIGLLALLPEEFYQCVTPILKTTLWDDVKEYLGYSADLNKYSGFDCKKLLVEAENRLVRLRQLEAEIFGLESQATFMAFDYML